MRSNRKAKRAARELFGTCRVEGGLDAGRARAVARLLAASTRRGALGTLAEFQRLVRLDQRDRTASIESAVALEPPLRDAITGQLARRYGARVEPVFAENPELIGGVRVTIGSNIYDGSIRRKLLDIERTLRGNEY
ncbi:MAG TPA: F0F1 ATP synthase subunit delta [Vicinamibacterales bacterium]